MHSTNSYLYTLLERIRGHLDEGDVDGKYSDDYIVRHIICPAQVDVMSRLSLTTGSPVILEWELTLDPDDGPFYRLPPCINQVLKLQAVDSEGTPVTDFVPRSIWHREGAGWAVEGNPGALRLKLYSQPTTPSTFIMWYTSNGDVLPHYGTGTLVDDATDGVQSFILAANPTLGVVDRREHAYCGQYLRLLPATGIIEERIISDSYLSGSDWVVEVEEPFDTTPNTTTSEAESLYEIAPAGSQPLIEATACWSAMKLGVGRKISQSHYQMLTQHYKAALKTIGDNLVSIQGRMPPRWERDTADNPANHNWFPIR